MEAAASYPQCLGPDYPKAPDGTLLLLAWSVGTLIAQIITAVSTYRPCRSGEPYGKSQHGLSLCQWQYPGVVRATEPGGKELCGCDGRAD